MKEEIELLKVLISCAHLAPEFASDGENLRDYVSRGSIDTPLTSWEVLYSANLETEARIFFEALVRRFERVEKTLAKANGKRARAEP